MSSATVSIGRRSLEVSNLEKVLYPKAEFTKGEVIDYYARVAAYMLPHLKGRPLTMKRFPNGVDQMFFYEKRCPVHRPKWMKTAPVLGSEDVLNYCVIEDEASLIWVANLASIELHTLMARYPNIGRPTSMVFDLDPGPPADMMKCIEVGQRLRGLFKQAGLECFAKTSGGKGLHLWVPLNTGVTFDQTKSFARSVAQILERDDPKHVTYNMKKSLRAGKVFIDWSQNDEHKTTVCVYSLRAMERPTVSTPVTWEELERAYKAKDAGRLVFEAGDVLKRVDRLGDLFSPTLKLKQKLPALGLGK